MCHLIHLQPSIIECVLLLVCHFVYSYSRQYCSCGLLSKVALTALEWTEKMLIFKEITSHFSGV